MISIVNYQEIFLKPLKIIIKYLLIVLLIFHSGVIIFSIIGTIIYFRMETEYIYMHNYFILIVGVANVMLIGTTVIPLVGGWLIAYFFISNLVKEMKIEISKEGISFGQKYIGPTDKIENATKLSVGKYHEKEFFINWNNIQKIEHHIISKWYDKLIVRYEKIRNPFLFNNFPESRGYLVIKDMENNLYSTGVDSLGIEKLESALIEINVNVKIDKI